MTLSINIKVKGVWKRTVEKGKCQVPYDASDFARVGKKKEGNSSLIAVGHLQIQ